MGEVPGKGPRPIQSLYPHTVVARGCPKRHFGENQISPSLIRLLLLPTGHAKTFQRFRLRSSRTFYRPFNLPMGRSLGFGSATCDLYALFRLAFATAPCRKHLALPHTTTRRSIMQKVRRHPGKAIGLRQFVGTWFQVLLTPLAGVLFTFQSPYFFSIGRAGVLSLGEWAPHVQSEFHELRPTRPPTLTRRLRDCHPLWSPFPECSTKLALTYGSKPWADPLSLAATYGVSVDFLSSGY